MAPEPVVGLRARKRSETRQRLARHAERLAAERGLAATTVDDIARAAGVGRATFFRYFDSKELAVATGLSDVAIYVLTAAIVDAPADLGPLDAVRSAFAALGADFDERRAMFREQAELTRCTPAMWAWTLRLYEEWERAIADAVAPRVEDLRTPDPRPRMVGAMAMVAARLGCDAWLAEGARGDLPAHIQEHLAALDLVPAGRARARPADEPGTIAISITDHEEHP